jgi:hypothetical protein
MTMEPHDPRDLDGVIDDVARAMTATAPAPDLRPALASRIVSRPSSTFAWRAGIATAAAAAVVLAAVVLWPRPVTPPSRVATVSIPAPTSSGVPEPRAVVAQADAAVPRAIHRVRAVASRQIASDSADAEGVVEITPLAILPLEEERTSTSARANVEIAPIEVEPVRIDQLELVE